MAWSLVAHTGQGSADTNGFTTTAINTTGADLIVLCVADVNGTATISADTASNTWHSAKKQVGGFGVAIHAAKLRPVGSAGQEAGIENRQ